MTMWPVACGRLFGAMLEEVGGTPRIGFRIRKFQKFEN